VAPVAGRRHRQRQGTGPEFPFDVDTIDSNEVVLGLGAEFIPRQVIRLQQILDGFPLISGTVR
jgi:hypothetical protein